MSEVSERVSVAEHASKASNVVQANKWAVLANDGMDEQVAQYLHMDSRLFWTIVQVEKYVIQTDLMENFKKTQIKTKNKKNTFPWNVLEDSKDRKKYKINPTGPESTFHETE